MPVKLLPSKREEYPPGFGPLEGNSSACDGTNYEPDST